MLGILKFMLICKMTKISSFNTISIVLQTWNYVMIKCHINKKADTYENKREDNDMDRKLAVRKKTEGGC